MKNLHESENIRWFNLQPLFIFSTLVGAIIEHPYALALSSSTMRNYNYLQARPKLKLSFLTPIQHSDIEGMDLKRHHRSPSIPRNYDTFADLADLPTTQGVWSLPEKSPDYLGPQSGIHRKTSKCNFRKVDFGTFLTLDKGLATAIQRKFPNAAISSSWLHELALQIFLYFIPYLRIISFV